jgi:cytoskeletal protein CcmA (bactofilin family)
MSEIKEIIEDENKISTVIAEDIEFKGKLVFKNSLKIKGIFEGKIESDGHLIIGQEAKVSAEVNAGLISVNGAFNGRIKANRSVELFKKSSTSGDIVTPEFYIEKGADFNGTCVMNSDS